jgi:large subunit ribosomal protein L21
MYAVVLTGGKQYKAGEGDILEVERLYADVGEKVELDTLMLVDGEKVLTGAEVKSKAEGVVVSHNKAHKLVVFKYKPDKNERKKKGHRQLFTKIKITKLV